MNVLNSFMDIFTRPEHFFLDCDKDPTPFLTILSQLNFLKIFLEKILFFQIPVKNIVFFNISKYFQRNIFTE